MGSDLSLCLLFHSSMFYLIRFSGVCPIVHQQLEYYRLYLLTYNVVRDMVSKFSSSLVMLMYLGIFSPCLRFTFLCDFAHVKDVCNINCWPKDSIIVVIF